MPFLKIYTTYNNNYELVEKALDEMYLLDWWTLRTIHRLELVSMLVAPIQRIPRYSSLAALCSYRTDRYRMLVEDLLAHTPDDHPDDKTLKEALKLIVY